MLQNPRIVRAGRASIATRAVATALSTLALVACARHEERELTGWLKVDIARPPGGTSGSIVAGRSKETFHVKVGSRWERLGSGHPCVYMVLSDPNKEYHQGGSQPAALIDLNDGKGMQIVREGEEDMRPVKEVFGRTEGFTVPPSRSVLDFWDCRERATEVGCRDLQIHRHDLGGALVNTFRIPLGETYPGCELLTIRFYDGVGTPIVNARCARDSEPQCLWATPRKEGLMVRAVGRDRPARDCSDSPGLNVALSQVERLEVLR